MKKQYNIPSTTTVAFRASFICQAASPAASGLNISGNTGLGNGGQGENIDPM
jgi:hypothetical protein